jgi:hypothetical protein
MEFNHTIVILKNWLRVANFSSLHTFTFEDGTNVPSSTAEKAIALAALKKDTIVAAHEKFRTYTTAIELTENIEKEIAYRMHRWQEKEIDIVLVPSIVIEGLGNKWFDILNSPFRNGKSKSGQDHVLKCNEFYIK